jgi:hypothetical protein
LYSFLVDLVLLNQKHNNTSGLVILFRLVLGYA